MKTFSTHLSRILLIVLFVFGISQFADAAFPGKQTNGKQTETVKAQTGTKAIMNPVNATASSDESTVLLVILSILLPPLAVYLKYHDTGKPFIWNIILTLCFWIPGVIHALYHVLR